MRSADGLVRPPVPHRVARRLAAGGLRGASRYWRLARVLAPEPEPGVIVLGDGTPIIHEPSDWTCRGADEGTYEREILRLLPRLLRAGDACIDVGANIGIFSARAAHLVGCGGAVVAVEPSPRCQADLDLVVEGMANVMVLRAALGPTTGVVQLSGWDNPDHRGLGTVVTGHRAGLVENWFDGQSIEVAQLCLADVIAEHTGDREIGLLKIDVEGYEPEVLAGAPGLFADGLVRTAILEVTPDVDASWAADLIASAVDYEAFVVGEVGGLVRRTDLRPVVASEAAARPDQWNLLLRRRL